MNLYYALTELLTTLEHGDRPRPADPRRLRANFTIISALLRARAALLVAIALSLGLAPASRADKSSAAQAVGPIGITVRELDRSIAFYRDVLGFEVESVVERSGESQERYEGVFGLHTRIARLRLGQEEIELTDYLAPEGRSMPEDSRSNDAWFQHIAIVTQDMERAYAWLRAHEVEHASTAPQRLPDWNPNAGGISAFYFRDPDHHNLEIIQFPAGKGDPRWQAPSERMFLGIDHTAIVVTDTDRSIAFYHDLLGLRVAGHSENYGTEQEHLNNVFGARLRITGLRAATGPGVELLEYLAPRDGRSYPVDSTSNDLWHWQTTLFTADASALAQRLETAGTSFVSPGPIALNDEALGVREGLLVRDPDGHVIAIDAPFEPQLGIARDSANRTTARVAQDTNHR